MMLHLIFQMVVYRPIVLVLAVRSRFHSTSVSLIHHSWQTTFQCQITMSSACFYYAAFAMQSQQHLYLKFILNQSNSLQMMSFDISCSCDKVSLPSVSFLSGHPAPPGSIDLPYRYALRTFQKSSPLLL
jgi:hypothetical protein